MMRLVFALALAGAASAEVTTITVSGGSFTDFPYYTFDGVAHRPELEEGKTYRFVDGGVSSGHPFRLSGSLDASNPGASDFELPVEFTITSTAMAVGYYCAAHPSMSSSFNINPASTPTPTPTPIEGGDDGDDGDGDDLFGALLGDLELDNATLTSMTEGFGPTIELLTRADSICTDTEGQADLRARIVATGVLPGATWDKAVNCLCNTLETEFIGTQVATILAVFPQTNETTDERILATQEDVLAAIDAVKALISNSDGGLLSTTKGVCASGDCLDSLKEVADAIIPTLFAAISLPEKLSDDLYTGALDLLGCMCSGLDLTDVVAPLLEMVMPTIAEVETADSLNKLTLYQIIHKAQTAVSGFMAPTLLCSTSCKSSAGNVLHLAFEAARFFLSDANQNPASDLVDLPTFPFPPLPADLNDDVDASIDCLCAASVNLGDFLAPIKDALKTFIPDVPIGEQPPCCVVKGEAMRRGGDPEGEYYSVLSDTSTCEDLGLSEYNETTRALKQSKKEHFANTYGLLGPHNTVDGGDNGDGPYSCCGPCPEEGDCEECHCGRVYLTSEDRCSTEYLPNWPKLGDGSMDLFHGVVMNVAKLADVAISPKGLCGSGCDVALTRMTKLFTGYALDMSLPGGTTTVPDAIKAGAVNLVDSFKSCLCGGTIKIEKIAETLQPLAPMLTRLFYSQQYKQEHGLNDEGLFQDMIMPAIHSAAKGFTRKMLSPAGACGGPCEGMSDAAFDLAIKFEATVNEMMKSEADLDYIELAVQNVTGSGVFQPATATSEKGALYDIYNAIPLSASDVFTPLKDGAEGKAGSHAATFKLPSNIKATFDAWGGCACGGEISFDPLYDAIFDGLLQPIFAENFTFAPGDATDDVIPFAKRLVPYLLGPQFLCGGKCKAAFGSTLRSLFDKDAIRALLADADIFSDLNVQSILNSLLGALSGDEGDGTTIDLASLGLSGELPSLDTIIGASIPDSFPIKIGSLSSCMCGVGPAGWSAGIDGLINFLGNFFTENDEGELGLGEISKPTVLETINWLRAPDFVLCKGLCLSSILGVVADVVDTVKATVTEIVSFVAPPEGSDGDAATVEQIERIIAEVEELVPLKQEIVDISNSPCLCAADTNMSKLVDFGFAIVGGFSEDDEGESRRRLDGHETPEQMLPGVIDSLTTCSASQELAADPPKPNAIRFVVETAAKKEDGTMKEVDVDEYKKNLALALGVSEEKVAVIEKIKHKVKATYVLKQTLDEFESSGMRAKIITKIATAAGVSEDAVEIEVQQADLETRRRRRLSEGVTVKATITTDDKEAAITAKAAMPTTTEDAALLLEVEVAEVTEAPAEEEVVELEATIIADTPAVEAEIDGSLNVIAASEEAASTALGIEVAETENVGFVDADDMSPPPPSPPPSPAPPPVASPPPAIPSAIEDAVRAALALPVGAIIGIAVGGFFVVVVCPILIAIVCCCCMKSAHDAGVKAATSKV